MKLKNILLYLVCVLLGCIYLIGLILTRHPRVSEEYEMYYINNQVSEWFGEGSFAYELDQIINFTNYEDRRYLGNGWSGCESWGTWSDGNDSFVFIKDFSHVIQDLELMIDISAFNDDVEMIEIYVNDIQVDRTSINEVGVFKANISQEIWHSNGQFNTIYIKVIGEIKSPLQKKMSNDGRKLGIGVKSMTIGKASE